MSSEYDATMVEDLAASHRRDLRKWSSTVARAQVLPKGAKESVLRALAAHDLGRPRDSRAMLASAERRSKRFSGAP